MTHHHPDWTERNAPQKRREKGKEREKEGEKRKREKEERNSTGGAGSRGTPTDTKCLLFDLFQRYPLGGGLWALGGLGVLPAPSWLWRWVWLGLWISVGWFLEFRHIIWVICPGALKSREIEQIFCSIFPLLFGFYELVSQCKGFDTISMHAQTQQPGFGCI